ncbi:MAG: thiamine phosphate synthase [Lachnospiraceae bacterium]|nr:thiamine phosphate synthase [Lachnospiraceae bacterium]
MKCEKKSMLLYAVTDRAWTGKQTLLEQIESALRGGITCLQLREKEMEQDAFLQEACMVKELCEKYHVPLVINDNVEVAVACRADGVHVGQNDMSPENVRKMAGKDMWIGVSAHTVEEALRAERQGADYLGVGSIFPTGTKKDVVNTTMETLREICKAVSIPVVAIGGIHESNISQLRKTGIDGVALVSAVFGAENIEETCKCLYKKMQNFNL